jgi:uncharacterized protein YndB with AHSA1/START domain
MSERWPMKKKLLIALGLFVGVIGVLAVVVAMQPDDMKISRSATFDAPPANAFALVNDFHKWENWSPWAHLDKEAKNSFEGPASGEGAIFKWSGNAEVGEGQMTIVESRPDELVRIKMDFTKPMQDTSEVLFTFKPEGDKTVTTWTMTGKHTFVSKGICLLMNMQKMMNEKFDEGLASMKALAEADVAKGGDAPPASSESSEKSDTPPATP